jgi:hypothetical protein
MRDALTATGSAADNYKKSNIEVLGAQPPPVAD